MITTGSNGGKQPTNKLFPTTKSSYLPSNGNNTAFVDLDTGEILGMQGLPHGMEYDPLSVFTMIKTPGRNNSIITFSDSDDILEFDISWYSLQDDKTDVLARCKWLESMTKADGYLGRPHICRLQWGKVFAKAMWIVTSAKYHIKDWDATKGMYPTCASQRVVLKRFVLSNPTHEQINDIQW